MMDRRSFLHRSALAALGLGATTRLATLPALAGKPSRAHVTYNEATERSFPSLYVAGSYHMIGLTIGRQFGPFIKTALERRAEWYKPLYDYATGEGKSLVDEMMAAAHKHTPAVVEELKGWAEGAGMAYRDLFIFNCKSEIEAFIDSRCGCAGCSTVVVKDDSRLLIFHNEDGHKAYKDLMFVVHTEPLGSSRSVGLAYPGILEGNAPWVNEHGVVMTTNYIPGAKVVPGIPRYFLDRTAMASKSVEEALRVVSHPERAYSYHHVIGSLVTKRAFSLEATVDKVDVHEITGLFWHTNHLVWDKMKDEPQFEAYMKKSSYPRYESLRKDLGDKPVEALDHDTVMKALTNHVNAPYGVCRHADAEASGSTLGSAFFEAPTQVTPDRPFTMRLRRNQPCLKLETEYTV